MYRTSIRVENLRRTCNMNRGKKNQTKRRTMVRSSPPSPSSSSSSSSFSLEDYAIFESEYIRKKTKNNSDNKLNFPVAFIV